MRIGVLLGTFDPVHIGHLSMAKKCVDNNLVDKVLFVPAMNNPWKDKPVLDYLHRCLLIDKLIPEDYKEKMFIDEVEFDLSPPYYSCNTLEALSKKYINDEIFIIGGADVINSLPNWMNYESMIKDKYTVIGFTRSNVKINSSVKHILVNFNVPNISSTEIRNYLKTKTNYPKELNEYFEKIYDKFYEKRF